MGHICFNGKFLPAGEPVLQADNRGYRYGDGLFETMKLWQEKILLEELHFERLFSGLSVLKFETPLHFSPDKIRVQISVLCQKNNCTDLARIRLSVFRGNGGLYEEAKRAEYLIECWPLNESVNRFNENGLIIDIYTDAKKSCDSFSNLKSASFLPYIMAAHHAKKNQINDCLILNTEGNIADSTIANIFLIKGGIIKTPALSQGCVAGVMRRHLLPLLLDAGYTVQETSISETDLKQADEVFLTNAINGIRWVKQFREKTFGNDMTGEIYNRFIKSMFF